MYIRSEVKMTSSQSLNALAFYYTLPQQETSMQRPQTAVQSQ